MINANLADGPAFVQHRALPTLLKLAMNTPDPLDELLSEWRVTVEPAASLPRVVWARIASEEVEPSLWDKLAFLLLQPRWLALTAVVAVSFGVVLALSGPRTTNLDPHTAYIESISPFASMHMAAH